MLAAVRTLALSLCGTMIVTGIFMMLAPSAEQNKVLRTAVSLFFLLSLAAPFAGSRIEWREELMLWKAKETEITDFRSLTEEILLSDFRSRLEKQAYYILKEEGIEPLELEFSIHTDDQDRIFITGLKLLLDEQDAARSADAVARLNSTFGLTVTLALSESEEG